MQFLRWYSFIVVSIVAILAMVMVVFGMKSLDISSPVLTLAMAFIFVAFLILYLPVWLTLFLIIRNKKPANGLKWFSAIVVSLFVFSCLIDVFKGEIDNLYALVLFIPVAIYLWKLIINKKHDFPMSPEEPSIT